MDTDSFGSDHQPREPEDDYLAEGCPFVTGLTILSEHDFPGGVVSDNIIEFEIGDDMIPVMVALDPEFSALLCICLLKRVHPDVFLAMQERVPLGEGVSIAPVSTVPSSAEGIQWARNRAERRHGRDPRPGQI